MTYLKDSVKMLQAIFGCGTACLLELYVPSLAVNMSILLHVMVSVAT
jgi:hypothetical protein